MFYGKLKDITYKNHSEFTFVYQKGTYYLLTVETLGGSRTFLLAPNRNYPHKSHRSLMSYLNRIYSKNRIIPIKDLRATQKRIDNDLNT